MDKVYAVTAGCYSDYHICKIFDNKEAAEEYARQCHYSRDYWDRSASVEIYDLEHICKKPQKEPVFIVDVWLNEDGTFDEEVSLSEYNESDAYHKEIMQRGYEFDTYKHLQSMPVQVRPGESLKNFEKRARKIIIDAWHAWKHMNTRDKHV